MAKPTGETTPAVPATPASPAGRPTDPPLIPPDLSDAERAQAKRAKEAWGHIRGVVEPPVGTATTRALAECLLDIDRRLREIEAGGT